MAVLTKQEFEEFMHRFSEHITMVINPKFKHIEDTLRFFDRRLKALEEKDG